jgi:hypothetical protein
VLGVTWPTALAVGRRPPRHPRAQRPRNKDLRGGVDGRSTTQAPATLPRRSGLARFAGNAPTLRAPRRERPGLPGHSGPPPHQQADAPQSKPNPRGARRPGPEPPGARPGPRPPGTRPGREPPGTRPHTGAANGGFPGRPSTRPPHNAGPRGDTGPRFPGRERLPAAARPRTDHRLDTGVPRDRSPPPDGTSLGAAIRLPFDGGVPRGRSTPPASVGPRGGSRAAVRLSFGIGVRTGASAPPR